MRAKPHHLLHCHCRKHCLKSKSKQFVQSVENLYNECSQLEPENALTWRQNEERKRFETKEQGRMQENFEAEQVYIRKYTEFPYQAKEWPHARRIICKVERNSEKADIRYVVTNSSRNRPAKIYEKYCQRAQCENWIKDLKNYLRCDRTSCQEFNANQLRLCCIPSPTFFSGS
ncbi:MAG: transposase [Cyanobacteriota/Melainabacteria group bacterium]